MAKIEVRAAEANARLELQLITLVKAQSVNGKMAHRLTPHIKGQTAPSITELLRFFALYLFLLHDIRKLIVWPNGECTISTLILDASIKKKDLDTVTLW